MLYEAILDRLEAFHMLQEQGIPHGYSELLAAGNGHGAAPEAEEDRLLPFLLVHAQSIGKGMVLAEVSKRHLERKREETECKLGLLASTPNVMPSFSVPRVNSLCSVTCR